MPEPAASLADTTFAVVDVETTGLDPRRHRLLQVAVVLVGADGGVRDRWSTYLRPGLTPIGGRSVHGLTRRVLRGAPRFADVAPDLVRRLDGTVVCAHNLAFDWAFLSRALERCGHEVPDASRLCTLELARAADPENLASHRLSDLCARYGVALDRAHDAAADATATATLLPLLLAELAVRDRDGLATHLHGGGSAWPPIHARIPSRKPRWWSRWRGQVSPAR